MPTQGERRRNFRFRPARFCLACLLALVVWSAGPIHAASTHPYYLRTLPKTYDEKQFLSNGSETDLFNAHAPAFLDGPVDLAVYHDLFDKRAAAAVRNAAAVTGGYPLFPTGDPGIHAQLEQYTYEGHIAPIYHLTPMNLALMAYPDYFPKSIHNGAMRASVSLAILNAKPGYCGTFGPNMGVIDMIDHWDGNYNMGQMYLLALIYRYYDELTPQAREYLINELLQRGTIDRPGMNRTYTNGAVPMDWMHAGYVPVVDIPVGETENHILTILTVRYLTNQLLYQRDDTPDKRSRHDNRRYDTEGPAPMTLVLELLWRILRNDFSEYNAKNYQEETRWALLNLCSYAYDHEVRLAARMVLDYISAHFAVSSSDMRRMIPFRRLNEAEKVTRHSGSFMGVGLTEGKLGADPMTAHFAMQSGNLRAFEGTNDTRLVKENNVPARLLSWTIPGDGAALTLEMLSDYRLPPSIQDLMVNDSHRRFYQRLHRRDLVEPGGNRNTDNLEIYAGSPSYLISAGGAPARQAIPGFNTPFGTIGAKAKDRGFAMTTSFMPTGQSAGYLKQNQAWDLIQFGHASDIPGDVDNYGVAPDFACGDDLYLPDWVTGQVIGQFLFVKKGYSEPNRPAFYLAIYRQADGFALMEAFDAWHRPKVTFEQFRDGVLARNSSVNLQNNVEAMYTTHNGNRIHFVIWRNGARAGMGKAGALVLNIVYPPNGDPFETLRYANYPVDKFLSGTVLDSTNEAVVRITNPMRGESILIDMKDPLRPRRISETGEVEQAGFNHEVWVDFDWDAASEGDFFRPFKSLPAAASAVAEGGTIRLTPGRSPGPIQLAGKRMRLVAPIGGVRLGGP